MDEALRERLDDVERRQQIVIVLLAIPYLLDAFWIVAVPVVNDPGWGFIALAGGAAAVLAGFGYIGYRGRQPSRQRR